MPAKMPSAATATNIANVFLDFMSTSPLSRLQIIAPLRYKAMSAKLGCVNAFHQHCSVIGVVMNNVQIGQKSYEMPPREGMSIAHFLTVADIGRSARYYEKVFGARILSLGDGNAPGYLQLANIWMILNVGGGPTPDKPTVTLSVPDPNHINSFMNFRVADIQACYELWKSRGAEFITEPLDKYGETRCYIRDPDGYIIEVGQSKPEFKYG